jgi:flagellar protein FlaG
MSGPLNVQRTSQSLLSLQSPARAHLNANSAQSSSEKARVDNAAQASKQSPSALNSDELKTAVKRLDELARLARHELQFSVDETSGRFVIKVIDSESNEVIRQVPPEEVLDLIARFEDFNSGLVNTEA